jgi:hypothetical protein
VHGVESSRVTVLLHARFPYFNKPIFLLALGVMHVKKTFWKWQHCAQSYSFPHNFEEKSSGHVEAIYFKYILANRIKNARTDNMFTGFGTLVNLFRLLAFQDMIFFHDNRLSASLSS